MAITSGSSWIRFCWATTMPKAAPTRARPTITRNTAGQPPRATNGASQTRPPPSARHLRCWLVSACRHTRAAPAQANATGQKQVLAESPAAGLHQPQQPGRQGGQGEQGAPVDPSLRLGRGPQTVATRRLQPGSGVLRLGRQQQPQGSVRDRPEELDQQQADETDADHHHRPPEVPRQTGAHAAEDGPLRDPGRPGTGRLLLDPGAGGELRDDSGCLGRGPDVGQVGRVGLALRSEAGGGHDDHSLTLNGLVDQQGLPRAHPQRAARPRRADSGAGGRAMIGRSGGRP